MKHHRFAFSGGQNVTLRGSQDDEWGWVDGHGQPWWDAGQQTNRPHGWAFSKVQGGAIHDMKLWKVFKISSGSTAIEVLTFEPSQSPGILPQVALPISISTTIRSWLFPTLG